MVNDLDTQLSAHLASLGEPRPFPAQTGLALLNATYRDMVRAHDTTTAVGCRDAWQELRVLFAGYVGPDRVALMHLAEHFSAKGDAVESHRDEDWRRATDWLTRARKEARKVG